MHGTVLLPGALVREESGADKSLGVLTVSVSPGMRNDRDGTGTQHALPDVRLDRTDKTAYDFFITKKGRALAADEDRQLTFGFVNDPLRKEAGAGYDAVWRL